jgi:ABC-type nitrate/sulfonate/bicarbonate transport system substrate-binding protein
LSYQTKSEPFDLVGIGAIFQKDTSAIVTLKTSKLDRPAKLDGKRYASYKARYEDKIVRQMIINDGGKGDMRISYPEKLGIWDTLLQSKGDATWVFMNWEGILAEGDGIELHAHYLSDYKIPYGYSPVIAGARSVMEKSPYTYRDFLTATKKGFQFCQNHPEQAAEILRPQVSTADAKIDLVKSQQSANQYYGMENWGILDSVVLDTFLDWLRVHSLDDSKLTASDLSMDLTQDLI